MFLCLALLIKLTPRNCVFLLKSSPMQQLVTNELCVSIKIRLGIVNANGPWTRLTRLVSLPDELVKLEAGGVQGQVGHQAVDGVLKSEDSYNFIHGTHNWKIFEACNTNKLPIPSNQCNESNVSCSISKWDH